MNDQELIKKYKGTNPKYQAWDDATFVKKMREQRPDLAGDPEPSLMGGVKKIAGSALDSVKPAIRQGAEFLTGPGRMVRGLGVGAELAGSALGKGQMPSAESIPPRMVEAMKPTYEPKKGEKLGAFASGFADPLNYVVPEGGAASKILGGGANAMATSLLDQIVKGKGVKGGPAALSGALGGLTGGLSHAISKSPNEFLEAAPKFLKTISQTPEEATHIFMANKGIENEFPRDKQALEHITEVRSEGVRDAMTNLVKSAKNFWGEVAGKAKIRETPKELIQGSKDVQGILSEGGIYRGGLKGKEIPAVSIPDAFESMKSYLAKRMSKPKASYLNPTPKDPAPLSDAENSALLKTLLYIRHSIDHHVNPKPGAAPIFSPQQKGLTQYRKEVDSMIESLPFGKEIKTADQKMADAMKMMEKLKAFDKRPGELLAHLKGVFSLEGPNHREDMMNLLELEKMSTANGGPPLVEPLFRALTMGYFNQGLANNQISRSIAGASPFLISGLMRWLGVPFQVSLPTSAAMVTGSKSPYLQGQVIRAAQKYGPGLSKIEEPLSAGLLNLIRQRDKNKKKK